MPQGYYTRSSLKKRMEQRTRKISSGCWVWYGGKDKDGYGQITVNGRTRRVHQVAWEREHGRIPKGLCICHDCDNRPCWNPKHLFLGTNADNMKDAALKGRFAGRNAGESCGTAKWTALEVAEVRFDYEAGIPQSAISRERGIPKTTVHNIVRRKTWKS